MKKGAPRGLPNLPSMKKSPGGLSALSVVKKSGTAFLETLARCGWAWVRVHMKAPRLVWKLSRRLAGHLCTRVKRRREILLHFGGFADLQQNPVDRGFVHAERVRDAFLCVPRAKVPTVHVAVPSARTPFRTRTQPEVPPPVPPPLFRARAELWFFGFLNRQRARGASAFPFSPGEVLGDRRRNFSPAIKKAGRNFAARNRKGGTRSGAGIFAVWDPERELLTVLGENRPHMLPQPEHPRGLYAML